ncbi:MAG TPA: M48 family metalloprotease, partial [Gammaproteobacteria bacterium]
MTRSQHRAHVPAIAIAALAGCVINPVTGDRELALVTAEQELAIGEQQYAPSQQMQGGEYSLDPALADYVSSVGQKVAAVSDRKLPYEFVVLNNSVPNAWALPGGKIAVNRGLLVELQSEAELAAVLGHEVVHAAARHGALAMQRGMLLQGALLATQVAAQRGDYGGLAVGAASIGAQLISQRNSRSAELEADLYGMRYMSAAGYDPAAAVSLQETFVRLSEQGGEAQGRLATLFASHPPSTERVQKNRETAT